MTTSSSSSSSSRKSAPGTLRARLATVLDATLPGALSRLRWLSESDPPASKPAPPPRGSLSGDGLPGHRYGLFRAAGFRTRWGANQVRARLIRSASRSARVGCFFPTRRRLALSARDTSPPRDAPNDPTLSEFDATLGSTGRTLRGASAAAGNIVPGSRRDQPMSSPQRKGRTRGSSSSRLLSMSSARAVRPIMAPNQSINRPRETTATRKRRRRRAAPRGTPWC